MEIEVIRHRLDSLLCELARETYLYGSGRKEHYDAAAIYRRHWELFSPFVLPSIRDRLVYSQGDENRRLNLLYSSVLLITVYDRVKDVTQRVVNQQGACTVHMEGQEFPWTQAEGLLVNQRKRHLRQDLERQIGEIARKLTPCWEQSWKSIWDLVDSMGFLSYTEFTEQVIDVDLHQLRSSLEEMLAHTDDLYLNALAPYIQQELGVKLDDATRGDLSFLFRGHDYDQWFTEETLVDTLRSTLIDLGLDLDHPYITLDIEPNPKKASTICSTAIQIPQEVYLLLKPLGGLEDYEGILHECGHVLHYAHTSPDLPMEFKRLGDVAVSEAYAFLFQYLTANEAWLKKHIAIPNTREYLKFAWLKKLFLVRRQAARVLFESWLHSGEKDMDQAREYYTSLMKRATGVAYNPDIFLADVSQRFYSVQFLRGWIFEAQIRAVLQRQLGPEWIFSKETGTLLKQFFAQGNKYNARELSRQLGYPRLEVKALVNEFQTMLG